MATRYYLTKKAPDAILHGPLSGNWNQGDVFRGSPVTWIYKMQTTKTTDGSFTSAGSSRVDWHFFTNQQGNHDFPFSWRWVTNPLQAQSISGNFNFCFGIAQYWDTDLGIFNSSVVRWKVHVFLADGQTLTPKTTLINNYVDSVDLPYSTVEYRSLVAAQAVTAATAAAGDIIVVELGVRIVSSPTPVPTYPPNENTHIYLYGVGAHPSFPDAIAGVAADSIPWIEFSANLLEQPAPSSPSNVSCATAIDIPSLPATTTYVNSTVSSGTLKEVWWKFTAPNNGVIHVTAHGSNHASEIGVFLACGGAQVSYLQTSTLLGAHRSMAAVKFNAVAGTQYFVRLRDVFNAGGLSRINIFYQETAYQNGDIFLPNVGIFAFRDGQMVNYDSSWTSYPQTGVAIDYSRKPILNIDDGTIHTGERLYFGLHDYELVEAADLYNLELELSFIGDPWYVANRGLHPAQTYITLDGMIHQAWFGNGYLYVVGSGSTPAALNTIASVPAYSALKSISVQSGDDEVGAPFTDTERLLAIDITSPWAIRFDEVTGILYYTSGGFYVPVGGDKIKRYNINSNTQLPDFATVPLQGTNNPGLKGLDLLPDGGLVVCNGTVVNRLNSLGVVTQTYTPSISVDSQTLVDVKLTPDQTKFWVVDLWTTRFFQFDVATGAELQTFQPFGYPGSLIQMAIYRASEVVPEPTLVRVTQVVVDVLTKNLNFGGIYFINPTKVGRFDSYFDNSTTPSGSFDVKIPNPTIKTALIGE